MGGFDCLGFEVRDQGAECRVAFGHRRGELVERVTPHRGNRAPLLAGSDLGVARVVCVLDAAIRVAAAQPLFGGPDVDPPFLVRMGPTTVYIRGSDQL